MSNNYSCQTVQVMTAWKYANVFIDLQHVVILDGSSRSESYFEVIWPVISSNATLSHYINE